jgi:hypothetical protein
VFADCRYAYQSDTAFISGFLGHDALVIDVGCTKHNHFSNEAYTSFVTEVLTNAKLTGVDVRIHTGKFLCTTEI